MKRRGFFASLATAITAPFLPRATETQVLTLTDPGPVVQFEVFERWTEHPQSAAGSVTVTAVDRERGTFTVDAMPGEITGHIVGLDPGDYIFVSTYDGR